MDGRRESEGGASGEGHRWEKNPVEIPQMDMLGDAFARIDSQLATVYVLFEGTPGSAYYTVTERENTKYTTNKMPSYVLREVLLCSVSIHCTLSV